MAVTKPEHIPAAIAAKIDKKGCPLTATAAPTAAPSVKLAYDGSGSVSRDPKNHSLCVFQTGKRYSCDLSASYNIGARYFIRELLKPLPVTERSLLEAKVPSVKRRTSCVYADLKELHLQMEILKAA